MTTPYSDLPAERYWRTAVAGTHPSALKNLYAKKFDISLGDRIATAGSCFAQHVARHMRKKGYEILDAEPPPFKLDEATAKKFGYLIYSGRYGNIYTARQLRQLLQDADKKLVRPEDIWEKDGRFYDGLRPNVEPNGLESADEARAHRLQHLAKVDDMFGDVDVLVFTLGLTEAWVNRKSGAVYPICPGVIAGQFDERLHEFKNFEFPEIFEDMKAVRAALTARNKNFRMLLTVSPVPLTATASGDHVLAATTYSKSVLRAVCGSMAKAFPNVDYFPSYELISAPMSRGFFYEPNLREVTEIGVSTVMSMFFSQHDDAGAATGQKRKRKKRRAGPDDDGELAARRAARRAALAAGGDRKRAGAGKARRKAVGEKRGGKRNRKQGDDVVCEEILLDALGKQK